jgi:GntR family transcriptional regulator / MocR family aminotransferase
MSLLSDAGFIWLLTNVGAIPRQLRSNSMPRTQTNPARDAAVEGAYLAPGNSPTAWDTLLNLSATRPGPLNRKLASAIRSAIREGRLSRGAVLPPSRMLADDLGISRWTVTQAYGQLVTEGYLTARTGSATRVRWSPEPDDDQGRATRPPQTGPTPPPRFDLYACRPDMRAFPRREWVASIRTAAETAPFAELDRSEPGGNPRLRTVLAEHLRRSRGAVAEPSTVSVFSGAGEAFSQACHALKADGHTAIGLENPGSPRLWQVARAAGIDVVPIPADADGLVVSALADFPELKAVCVGVARQIAFGRALIARRRSELLDWARRADAYIVEDDYDAEFSFDSPAPPVIQGADPHRVFLLGSMSKTLGPTVSVGWVVAPRRWVQAVRAEYDLAAVPPVLNELALVDFMESGAYNRYLRASRQRHRARRAALIAALARRLPQCHVHGDKSGLEVLLELPAGADAAAVVTEAERQGVIVCDAREKWQEGGPGFPGLSLGFGNLLDSQIDEAVAILAAIISSQPADGARATA